MAGGIAVVLVIGFILFAGNFAGAGDVNDVGRVDATVDLETDAAAAPLLVGVEPGGLPAPWPACRG